MQRQNRPLLQLYSISLEYEQKKLLNNINCSINKNDRIGLVGINGSGKTSLMKIIAGIINPPVGSISRNGSMIYVPQVNIENYRINKLTHKYLSERSEEWWEILHFHELIFGTEVDIDKKISKLSGGELAKLHLSYGLAQDPSILLLDEPTNHLDLFSINKLGKYLANCKNAYLIVSHNIKFLDSTVDKIWELKDGNIRIFGGNYSHYRAELEKIENAKKRAIQSLKKKVKKTKKSLNKEQIRYQMSQAKLSRMAKSGDRSIPKIIRTSQKISGQSKHGQNKKSLLSSIESIENNIQQLKSPKRKSIYLDFQDEKKKGLIFSVSEGTLKIGDKILLASLDFSIYHKDRIAIIGANASGKTTLVKELEYKKAKYISGKINYGVEYTALYVDQKHDFINPRKTLIENLMQVNPHINYEASRRILFNLGFALEQEINLSAGLLSGGETARLAFAMVTAIDTDLLILDEPTNNLDIETTEIIIQNLKNYTGTIVAISHDISFLESIGIQSVFLIKDQSIKSIKISNGQTLDITNII